MFEITLVRLSETSDYLLGQVNNPVAVIRRTSEKLQPRFYLSLYNAVIKRQNLRNSCPGSIRAAIVTKLLLTSASDAFEVDTIKATTDDSAKIGAVSRYVIQSIRFEASDRSRSLPLTLIHILASELSLPPIRKITH